jgi:ATP-binding cassette, subfamily G (WHITE), member 2, PDR
LHILAPRNELPGFWIFMYRVNPFTYLVSSFLATTLGEAPAYCAANEFQHFDPPQGQTCGEYMASYMRMAGGYLRDANATQSCSFCQITSTDQFLRRVYVDWNTRWRDFGLLWVYVVFNVGGAIFLYWLFRVPKGKKRQ